MEKPCSQKTVCIDFDDTLCDRADQPVVGAREAVVRFRQAGCRIIISSARLDPRVWGELLPQRVKAIKDWCTQHEIPIDDVAVAKPPADIYVDDRGCHFAGDWTVTEAEVAKRLGFG